MIYIYDLPNQKNIFASPAFLRELGVLEADFLQMDETQFGAFIHPEDVPTVQHHNHHIRPFLRDQEVAKISYRLQHRIKKNYIWIEASESIFERNDQGQILSIICFAENITEKKEILTKLEYTTRELEQFVFSVSHDMRAPVRHIETYIHILGQSDNHLSAEELRLVNKITVATGRLGKMIDELGQFSRNRNALPNKTHFDSFQLVMHLADHVASFFPDQKIVWDIQPLPACFADLNMMTIVWENLISNAVKFSSQKPETQISITAVERETEVEFSIRDNGAGFNMKFADKLFYIFQRVHTQREFPGTGIGLAIVRQIIEHHQGKIWVESVWEEGTTFFFTLPKK